MTNTWNIWDIPHPILRAIVAWLFAALAAVVVLVALPVAIVWLAIAGVVAGLVAGWRNLTDREWRELGAAFWAAATGKEAV